MYASLFTYGKVASKLFVGCTFCPESVFVLPWDGNEKGYISVKYGVRVVSQIKFTMSDSFLVFYDFDILSMIKRKTSFSFLLCHFDFKFVAFDFSNAFLISKI